MTWSNEYWFEAAARRNCILADESMYLVSAGGTITVLTDWQQQENKLVLMKMFRTVVGDMFINETTGDEEMWHGKFLPGNESFLICSLRTFLPNLCKCPHCGSLVFSHKKFVCLLISCDLNCVPMIRVVLSFETFTSCSHTYYVDKTMEAGRMKE